jgi:hypothetical protein
VIAVDDIHEAAKQLANSGGEVLGEPMVIPGIGHYVSFMNTGHNRVTLPAARGPLRSVRSRGPHLIGSASAAGNRHVIAGGGQWVVPDVA